MSNQLLNTNSDFPFSSKDFLEEFSIYEEQFEIYWYTNISKLSIFKYFSVEMLREDICAVGFKILDIEFFIGTFEHKWCLFSNKQNFLYTIKDIRNTSHFLTYNTLKTDFQIPIEIIYSIIRIANKYEHVPIGSLNERNFSSCWNNQSLKHLIPPKCSNCGKNVRKDNYKPKIDFLMCNPPWNSGWDGVCENCNYDYNFKFVQNVTSQSGDYYFKISRESNLVLSRRDFLDSLDSFTVLSGIELTISDITKIPNAKDIIETNSIFISTNELKFIISILNDSPLLKQYDWDGDCT
jgi:hypothetical protein